MKVFWAALIVTTIWVIQFFIKRNWCECCLWNWPQVSISPTFYEQLFCTKDFLYLHIVSVFLTGKKAFHKMLAKLTTVKLQFRLDIRRNDTLSTVHFVVLRIYDTTIRLFTNDVWQVLNFLWQCKKLRRLCINYDSKYLTNSWNARAKFGICLRILFEAFFHSFLFRKYFKYFRLTIGSLWLKQTDVVWMFNQKYFCLTIEIFLKTNLHFNCISLTIFSWQE